MKVFTIITGSGFFITEKDPLFKIFLDLPPECCQFVYTDQHLEQFPWLSAQLDALRARNIKIVQNGFESLDANNIVVCGGYAHKLNPTPDYEKLKEQGCQFLSYLDQTEAVYTNLEQGDFFLYSTETQLRCSIPKGSCCTADDGAAEVYINEQGGQGAAVGLVRDIPNTFEAFWREIAGEAPVGGDKRAAMRLLLEEELSVRFNPNLPLVLHFIDYHLEFNAVVKCLKALSRTANVLVKDIKWHNIDVGDVEAALNGPNIYVTNRHYVQGERVKFQNSATFNNLMRFAADFLLTSCFSGFASTSFLLGFRIIPVCTRYIYPWQTFAQKKYASFASQLRKAAVPMPVKIMDYITPIYMEAPDMLLARMNDADYWRLYDEKLPQLQEAAFGRHWMDEAALEQMKPLVLRLIQTGTFVPQGAALQPISGHPLSEFPGAPL